MLLLAGAAAAVLLIALLHGQFYYLQNVKAATAGQDVVMAVRRELFATCRPSPCPIIIMPTPATSSCD